MKAEIQKGKIKFIPETNMEWFKAGMAGGKVTDYVLETTKEELTGIIIEPSRIISELAFHV